MTRLHTLVAILLWVGFACGRAESPPPRPRGLPQSAVWAGGVDGGSWLDCSKVAGSPNRWNCKLFSQQNGRFLSWGQFLWDDPRAADAQVPPVAGAPGETIPLQHGALIPVGRHVSEVDGRSRLVVVYPDTYSGSMAAEPLEQYEEAVPP